MGNAESRVGERRVQTSVCGRLGRTAVEKGRFSYGERPRPHARPGDAIVTGPANDRSGS